MIADALSSERGSLLASGKFMKGPQDPLYRQFSHAAVIKRTFVEQATTASHVFVEHSVGFAKWSMPIDVVGPEENDRWGANEGGKVGKGAVITDEGTAAREELKDAIGSDLGYPEIEQSG